MSGRWRPARAWRAGATAGLAALGCSALTRLTSDGQVRVVHLVRGQRPPVLPGALLLPGPLRAAASGSVQERFPSAEWQTRAPVRNTDPDWFPGAYEAVYSPVGRNIAYVRNVRGRPEIYVGFNDSSPDGAPATPPLA
jgi:hypothetical protein